MSKIRRSFLPAVIFILFVWGISQGQDLEATIRIDAAAPHIAYIEGRFLRARTGVGARSLSFMLTHAGISGLGERFSDVRLGNGKGAVGARTMIAGEYLAEDDFYLWSYRVDLSPLKDASAAAHISWLESEGGIVNPLDILPQTAGGAPASARITFALPARWQISTIELPAGQNMYSVNDTDKAVFHIGPGRRKVGVRGSRLMLSLADKWHFSDDEAAAMAASIVNGYEKLFGSRPEREILIGISRYPAETAAGRWDAGTRGGTVTIISSDMPFKSQSLQRLHEQLRHEIFHLWIPNGVGLTGSYDWFYEGFALYQSLKTGVEANQIRFTDFLDTLSRAYDVERRDVAGETLIDASKRRWSGSPSTVYAKGMIVAFACDLALLETSKGKRSVGDVLKSLYTAHKPPAPAADGNSAVLTALKAYPDLIPIVDRNILAIGEMDLRDLLSSFGIAIDAPGRVSTIKVVAKPTGRQKDLLNKLGYNNWRKMLKGNQ